MRRFLSLFTMLMLCGVLAFAQTRVVSGKVTDIDGNPVSFATIKVKGSSLGLSADANGAYTIKVKTGDVLVISGARDCVADTTVQNSHYAALASTKKFHVILKQLTHCDFGNGNSSNCTLGQGTSGCGNPAIPRHHAPWLAAPPTAPHRKVVRHR